MPNFDGTGPLGQGTMTGRRRGRCWNKQTETNKNYSETKTEDKNIINGEINNREVMQGKGKGQAHRFRWGEDNGCGRGNRRRHGRK